MVKKTGSLHRFSEAIDTGQVGKVKTPASPMRP
jgi:hypothetical protein